MPGGVGQNKFSSLSFYKLTEVKAHHRRKCDGQFYQIRLSLQKPFCDKPNFDLLPPAGNSSAMSPVLLKATLKNQLPETARIKNDSRLLFPIEKKQQPCRHLL